MVRKNFPACQHDPTPPTSGTGSNAGSPLTTMATVTGQLIFLGINRDLSAKRCSKHARTPETSFCMCEFFFPGEYIGALDNSISKLFGSWRSSVLSRRSNILLFLSWPKKININLYRESFLHFTDSEGLYTIEHWWSGDVAPEDEFHPWVILLASWTFREGDC